jgi:RNA polymerase sigma-70 factor (ECF subfamily)
MQDRRRTNEEREGRWRAWMIGAQAGDAAAYEKLLLELLPHLRRFVRRRLNDVAATEDVVQNVFVAVHRARHTYRPERPFGPWLHAIARNAVIDHARSGMRRRRRERSLEENGVPEPAAEAEPAVGGRLSPELERSLAELPASQREAVLLLHVEELSVAEAAAWVGISKSALKVRAHRGYRALRERLGEKAP